MKSTHTISATQLYDLLHKQLGQATAEGLIQYLDGKTSSLATKEEMSAVRTELKNEVSATRTELKEVIKEKFAQELRVLATREDIVKVEKNIAKLETHMEKSFKEQEKNAKEQLKWLVGALFACASVIIAAIKLL